MDVNTHFYLGLAATSSSLPPLVLFFLISYTYFKQVAITVILLTRYVSQGHDCMDKTQLGYHHIVKQITF